MFNHAELLALLTEIFFPFELFNFIFFSILSLYLDHNENRSQFLQ